MQVGITPEIRSQLLENTREQALVFLDDMRHIRSVVAKESTDAGEVRRLSGLLRRLLINREISKIANPRIGRFELSAPDNNPFYKAAKIRPFLFFLSGRTKVFGHNTTLWAIDVPPQTTSDEIARKALVDDFERDRTVTLPLENFLKQRVLCYRGEWATREQVIKYVANVASGVHTTAPKDDYELLLAKVRSANRIYYKDGGIHVALLDQGLNSDEINFEYRQDSIDPVLIELLATAKFLSISIAVTELENIIAEENDFDAN